MENATTPESKPTTPVAEVTPVTTESIPVAPEAPKVEVPKEEDSLTSRFAAIAKREKLMREREQTWKKELEALKAEKSQFESLMGLKSKAKLDPMSWLKAAELSYDDVTKHILNDSKPTAESEVDFLKRKIEALENKEKEREKLTQKEKEEAAVQKFIGDIHKFVESNDKFELIKAYDYQNVVYNVIDQHYGETGELMDMNEACETVEKHLEDSVREEQKKYASLKKFSTKLAETPKTEPKPAPPKTLTNTTETSPRIDVELSPSQRLKEAAKLINFQS